MACCSCVAKLAYKLIENHRRLDLIRAYELAEKTVERVEKRQSLPELHTLTVEEQENLDFDPDYTQACVATGSCICNTKIECFDNATCIKQSSCLGNCPAPLPHSHYVSGTCGAEPSCLCGLKTHKCPPQSTCTCDATGGPCYYACDETYIWNPETQECELAGPSPGFNKLQYFTEPTTNGVFNKLKFASEPPVSGAWNKLLYEGE